MHVISETEERTVRTAAATMFGLAAPGQGSTELSTWRVELRAGSATPVHVIDREQVWMPLGGALLATVGDETRTVSAGQALVVPGGATRRLEAREDTQALVAMPAAGRVLMGGETVALPWAS